MKRIKTFLFVILLFAIASPVIAQKNDSIPKKTRPEKTKPERDPSEFWEKVFWGGNLGMQFGTITLVDISPLIGYRLTERIAVGVGATYQYYRYRDQFYDFATDVYGGRVLGRYYILENIFAHAEYEVLNLETFDNPFHDRINVNSVLVGGGFRQEIGANSSFSILGLWNLNESYYTPYANPIIRAGFMVGLSNK